jgi:uncharacterized protein (TIGR02147 family)
VQFTPEQLRLLAKSESYREFLKTAFSLQMERKGSAHAAFSYAAFARKAGLASRSFPRDVVLGNKRLTAASALAFADALEIKQDLRQLFLSLVDVEGHGNASTPLLLKKAKLQLSQVRKRLLSNKDSNTESETSLSQHTHWFEVYAGLGTQEHGAELSEVLERTGLSATLCSAILVEMANTGIVRTTAQAVRGKVHTRFHPTEAHVILDRLGESQQFKKIYLHDLKQVHGRARKNFQSKKELFFSSAFAIRSSKMEQFRSELRELMLRFLDQSEDAHGDLVVKLILGFVSNRDQA